MKKKFTLMKPATTKPQRAEAAAVAEMPGEAALSRPAGALPRLMTTAEVANQLGVARRTVDRWRLTGEGPEFVRLSSQTVRYTPAAVAAFIDARSKSSTAQL